MANRRRPSQASGQAPAPSKLQKKSGGKKKPWDQAVNTAKKASSWLNPLD